jgi:hypothetical protein
MQQLIKFLLRIIAVVFTWLLIELVNIDRFIGLVKLDRDIIELQSI